jgi:hypothetical protein
VYTLHLWCIGMVGLSQGEPPVPDPFQPLLAHHWVHVTREAARDVAHTFNSLVAPDEGRVGACRFILQCVVAIFAGHR